jgi:hypothetical protein
VETLEQFTEIEKPNDPKEGQSGSARRRLPTPAPKRLSDIFSSERDYDTQGRLYRGIEDGVRYLAQKHGEHGLFIGPTGAQTADAYFSSLQGLVPVTDLSSAMAAIKVIVEQGEGASHDSKDSHYSKFVSILWEYKQLLVENPNFQPARPVLANPYALLPSDMSDTSDIHLVELESTADLCNLFDGCYELLVQMLGRLFDHAEESEAELMALADIAVGLMFDVIEPLGSVLTTLPAGPAFPGLTAGPSFRLSRGATIPTHREPARFVFHERLIELFSYCRFLQLEADSPPVLVPVRDALAKFADQFKVAA